MPTTVLTSNPQKITVASDVAQVATVTLTGTSGTANITVAGGLTKLVTFNTTLTQTATDFDTTHSAAYTTAGITVTTSGADIIFTAAVAGVPFDAPVITNVTGNLAGTVVATTANSSSYGELDFEDMLPVRRYKTYTGNALVEYVSGTGVKFNVNGEGITADSPTLNSTNNKFIMPLLRDVNISYDGTAADVFIVTITEPS